MKSTIYFFLPQLSAASRICLLMLLLAVGCIRPANATGYGVVQEPAPVLNTSDFNAVFGAGNGQRIKTDSCGQLRELEFIALPGTVFVIRNKTGLGSSQVYQVESAEYEAPPNVRLYVAASSIKVVSALPPPRKPSLPSRESILSTLRGNIGKAYVWGGNVPEGVSVLDVLSSAANSATIADNRILAGLDCSGLLYHATNGLTPRNTSQLVTYGKEVSIALKRPEQIAAMLKPLDLIVWNGHVIIVLDQHQAIESRLECGKPGNGGVVISGLQQRLAEIMKTRRPRNTWINPTKGQGIFVVRRWYPS